MEMTGANIHSKSEKCGGLMSVGSECYKNMTTPK